MHFDSVGTKKKTIVYTTTVYNRSLSDIMYVVKQCFMFVPKNVLTCTYWTVYLILRQNQISIEKGPRAS